MIISARKDKTAYISSRSKASCLQQPMLFLSSSGLFLSAVSAPFPVQLFLSVSANVKPKSTMQRRASEKVEQPI